MIFLKYIKYLLQLVVHFMNYELTCGDITYTPFQLIALCLIVDYVVWAIYQIFMNKNSKKGGS